MKSISEIEKEFDEKFTRISLDPSELGAYKDKWFLKDYITAGDLKQFYRSKLTELLESLRMEEEDEPDNYHTFNDGKKSARCEIIQEINKRIDNLLK